MTEVIIMNRWKIGVAAAVVVLTSACSPSPENTAEASGAAEGIDIVVIDDGIGSLEPPAGDQNSCPGCDRWPTQFAEHVTQATGRETTVASYRAEGVPEARELVSGDAAARDVLTDAEVIVVATGAFNSLPDPDTGIGCPGELPPPSEYSDWARTTTPTCLAEGVRTYGLLYDAVFAEIKKLRSGKPTVYVTMTVPNYNIDVAGPDSLLGSVDGEQRAWAKQFAVDANERWNAMLEERAVAAGFAVADVYHAYNGPDGGVPAGHFDAGGGHPNQAGHDAIAALLATVDLVALKD